MIAEALPYGAIFIAAAVEGELVFVASAVLVGMGQLDGWLVFGAATLGGSAGDQFFFYVSRGRLRRWLARFPRLAERQEQVVARVREHATIMILGCRFLPGLRVAIPVACAYAGISALRFTTLNLIGSMAWAGTILLIVVYAGPATFSQWGLDTWGASLAAAIMLLGFLYWISRVAPGSLGHQR